jgi:hypothetical protein
VMAVAEAGGFPRRRAPGAALSGFLRFSRTTVDVARGRT